MNDIKRKGFTLIELIVVMAIILILGSLLIPRYNGYRSKAQNLKIIDTGRQIYLAVIESYSEGNEEFLEDNIKEITEDLLGINDIEVTHKDTEEETSITYSVDNKKYLLEFSDIGSGFVIKENSGGKQLHPRVSIKEIDMK